MKPTIFPVWHLPITSHLINLFSDELHFQIRIMFTFSLIGCIRYLWFGKLILGKSFLFPIHTLSLSSQEFPMIPANIFHSSLWEDTCIYKWKIFSELVLKPMTGMSKMWLCLCVHEEGPLHEASNSPRPFLECIFRVGDKDSYSQ